MPKTIQELQADVQRFKAMKQGLPDPSTTATTTPPASRPTASSTGRDFATIDAALKSRPSGYVGVAPEDTASNEPGLGEKVVKGLFSAPATIVARPVQAVAEGVFGADADAVDKFSSDISGGLIAPVPKNFGDVQKDVGRAAQTVALGTGAPIAGGALFGAGASLEAGNDLLSAQTAFDAALGGAGGKVIDLVGKPFINAAGKVVGVITPQIIKDVAAGGAKAIGAFAARHEIPVVGGITRPLSAGIEKGAQAVDTAIVGGIKKGGTVLKETAAKQFPGLNPVTHYTNAAERDLIKPTTLNESKYSKATEIYNQAKAQGIDLEKHATANRVFHDDLIGGGKFNTKEAEQALRDSVFKDGSEIIRPALKDIEPGVRLVPIKEVRDAMLKRIDSVPDAKLNATVKAQMRKTIERQYGDASAEAKAHPNGYTLTNLHDARIERGLNGKYVPGISTDPTVVSAKLARQQAKVFEQLFDNTIPASAGLAQIRREFQKNFLLADYLKALNGKKVPEGAAKKAVRLFGRAAAATVGGKIGGFPGAILGSQYGDMLFASFEALPNPLKKIVLSKLLAEKSPAFDVLRQYLGDVKAEKLLQKALPAPGQSSFKAQGPTLFTTPGGVSTPNKSEAIDVTAVEQGRARAPKTDRRLKSYLTKVQTAQDAQEPYVPGTKLPVIKTGRKPKLPRLKSDIYID